MKRRILIVDDELDVCLSVKMGLEENNSEFKVDSFTDPFMALENFRPDFYDLIILDIKMPKMNGFELYREIRKKDNKVKICFLTAGEMYYGVYTDIFNALDVKCLIRKPIDNKELIKRIDEIIQRRDFRP